MRVAVGISLTALALVLIGCSERVADPPGDRPTKDSYVWTKAAIDDVDCTDPITLPVTLDNTASTEAVVFIIEGREYDGTHGFDKTIPVPAGATQKVPIPVREHRQVLVYVSQGPRDADGEPARSLVSDEIDVACTPAPIYKPDAIVGAVRCADRTLPVTLDNRRSNIVAEFWVYGTDYGEREFDRRYRVPPGKRKVVYVPVGDDHYEFNAQVIDPPGTRDTWLHNDYRFKILCPLKPPAEVEMEDD